MPSYTHNLLSKGIEHFGMSNQYDKYEKYEKSELSILDLLIVAVSFYAAYLSWSCNKGVAIPLKIVYAFFAFLFGSFYVVFYGVFKGTFKPCPK